MSLKLYIFFESIGYRMIAIENKKTDEEKNKYRFDSFFSFRKNFSSSNEEISSFDLISSIDIVEEKTNSKVNQIIVIDQSNDIFVKNIECSKGSTDKEIKKLIKFDFEQNYNIDISKYVISYHKSKSNLDLDDVTAVIYPKSKIFFLEKINKIKKIKIAHIYLYFDILGHYLNGEIDFSDIKNCRTIFCRKADFILTIFEDGIISSSMVISTRDIDDNLVNFLNKSEDIYTLYSGDSEVFPYLKAYGKSYEVDIYYEIISRIEKNNIFLPMFREKTRDRYIDIVNIVDDREYFYKSILKIWMIIFLFFLVLCFNKYKNVSYEIKNEEMKYENLSNNLEVNRKKHEGYIDIEKIMRDISLLGNRIYSIDISSDKIEIELLIGDISFINEFIKNNENYKIEFIEKYKLEENIESKPDNKIQKLKDELEALNKEKKSLIEEIKKIENSLESTEEEINSKYEYLDNLEEKISKKSLDIDNQQKKSKVERNVQNQNVKYKLKIIS